MNENPMRRQYKRDKSTRTRSIRLTTDRLPLASKQSIVQQAVLPTARSARTCFHPPSSALWRSSMSSISSAVNLAITQRVKASIKTDSKSNFYCFIKKIVSPSYSNEQQKPHANESFGDVLEYTYTLKYVTFSCRKNMVMLMTSFKWAIHLHIKTYYFFRIPLRSIT